MRLLKIVFFGLSICLIDICFAGGPDYYQGKGRILISSDGNYHDKDDWAASAAALMILAKANLQSQVTSYIYSDHIWQSSEEGLRQMTESVVEGGEKFGFTNTQFIEAAADPEKAYNHVRNAINASTKKDPLFIIAAGPMQVIGEGINRANPEALNHVTVISHSTWNDEHAVTPHRNESKPWTYDTHLHEGWTWSELERKFGDKVNFNHIIDQNDYKSATKGFATTRAGNPGQEWESWHWMRDHQDSNVQWVYQRAVITEKPDWSDAGMTFYLVTGKQDAGPQDLRRFMDE
ncbi:MAG: hypothetical protein AAF789_06555 [Bacteroidota bacterium]